MVFFLIDFFFIGTNILFALGVVSGQMWVFDIFCSRSRKEKQTNFSYIRVFF